jgi:hypothetical protein
MIPPKIHFNGAADGEDVVPFDEGATVDGADDDGGTVGSGAVVLATCAKATEASNSVNKMIVVFIVVVFA